MARGTDTRRPNILMVMSDHHNGYALGSEAGSPGVAGVAPPRPGGHPPIITPVMDRLAREGVSFRQTRCTTPMCAPSRAALMSGIYAHSNGMWNNNHTPAAMRRDVYPDVRMWSQNLVEAGYRLRYIGKWHVSDVRSPAAFGWEEPEAAVTSGQQAEVGLPQHSRDEPYRPRPRDIQVQPPVQGRRAGVEKALYQEREGWPRRVLYATSTSEPEDTRDGRLTTHAVGLIEEQARWQEPWCLYVGWSNPHDPYVAHERYLRQYEGMEIPQIPSYSDDMRDKPNIYRRLHEQLWGHLPWEEMAQMIRHYCAMVTFLDDQLGKILEALARTGQAENTIVLYTSDHGDYVGAHGLFAKGVAAFDEAYRVPLLVRWPAGIVRPGRAVDAFTTLLDVGPTLLEVAGAQPLEQRHGRSLTPFLRGETPADWPDYFAGEFLGHENFYTQRQVRTRTHKYVWNAFDYDELYDLERDPYETRNLNDDPAYQEVKRDLIARLWRWAQETGDIINNAYPLNAILPFGPGILHDA
jgi:arylsulfatase A-like enzyme